MSAMLSIYPASIVENAVKTIRLPTVPKSLVYWDDFSECERTIFDFDTCELIEIKDDGLLTRLTLSHFSPFQRSCVRAIISDLLSISDVTSVVHWMESFRALSRRIGPSVIDQLSIIPPFDIKHKWESFIFPILEHKHHADALKRLLHFFCRYRVGAWAPQFARLVSNLSAPKVDPFRVVRSGDCFIPVEHHQIIYEHLDSIASDAARGCASIQDCRVGTALILADQHAFRPSTIARVKPQDVRIFNNGAVHVSAIVVKKQDGSERVRVTRRIKHEWCPIVRRFCESRSEVVREGSHASHRLLGWLPVELGRTVADCLERLCGLRWTATDLRHTAAQRMVDCGASADQLAEFLCQNSTLVGNLYFEQSPTQAARINDALAVSPIYSQIPVIHRTRTIDTAALLAFPEDNQIGGAPHGIAIAGIGACESGQSLCDKTPVLSCYGCRKFLAVKDVEIHEHVISSLRQVVLEFEKVGRGQDRSPAYTQLQRILTSATTIVNDLHAQEASSK